MPSGIGIYLRNELYPRLFKKAGKGLLIGRNVVIRHPDKVVLRDNVTIDDNCIIDGNGAVIGAGALIVKNMPENSIAFGVPAKVASTRD